MPVQMHPETAVGELIAGSYAFPLQAVEVDGTVRGLLYSAKVTQKFKNERAERLEAVYVFPLPPKAAVHGFKLKVGDRLIEGEIKERGAARREYQQAIREGHRAALMEEERSDIFTTTVGNIGPGEEVEIQFELSGPLSCFKNTSRLRLPLVVGEVYIPGRALEGDSVGEGTQADTDQVPDASRITPPRLPQGAANPVELKVSFTVEPAGLHLSNVASTCHFARIKKFEDGRFKVSLLPGVERMDRAFVLEVSYPEHTLQTSLLVDQANKAFALTVVPPTATERTTHPRDVVILLDRSGSMNGWPMIAARRAAARIVESLNQDDRFGIVAFDDKNMHFDIKNGLTHANNFYQMRAVEFLSKIEANGGTQVLPALRDGLSYFRQMDNRDPHIILITDGDVGNDSSLIRSCQTGVRISTVGIGYAAREGLLNRMAETSGGLCTLIPNESEIEKELAEMHRKWGQPVWKGLTLRGADHQFKSPKFWDVWQDVPTTFFGKLDELAEQTEVQGWFQGRGQYSEELRAIPTDDPVIYRSWARSRLLDLEDLFLVGKATPAELVQLSISAQVLCRFTAFSAVDKTERVDMDTRAVTIAQPVEQTMERAKKRSPALRSSAPMMRSQGVMASKPMLGGGGAGAAPPPPPVASAPAGNYFSEAFSDADDDLFGSAEPVGEAVFDLACEAPGELGAELSCLFEEPEAELDLFASNSKALPSLSRKREEMAPTWTAKPAKDAQTTLAQRYRDLLVGDQLLQAGEAPSKKSLQHSLDIISEMIKALTATLRQDENAGQDTNAWREILSKLIDYQESLQDALESGSVREARKLRKELQSLLDRIR